MAFRGELEEVDIVQVVEVLPIEPSEHKKVTTYKCARVPSSGLGQFSLYLHGSNSLFDRIENKDVLQVTAESSSKDIHSPCIDRTGMTPATQERGSFQLNLLPFQRLSRQIE